MGLTYKDSGVDIKKGDDFAKIIKKKLKNTEKENIGLFGGLYELDINSYKNPILVSSTDGVGTKLLIAKKANKYNTIGIDLVAMCVNDIITSGAKPLFFLDYMATGKLDIIKASEVIDGIIEGCKQADCMILGGETAEMPGVYQKNDYELAGFVTGIVEKDQMITGEQIKNGDMIIGLKSSGIHSNGLSLARKVLKLDESIIEELLKPTKIYVKIVSNILNNIINNFISIKGMAHITGGGIYNNIKRLLPEKLYPEIYWENVKIFTQPIFNSIASHGDVSYEEMRKTFNMGIGYVVIVSLTFAPILLKLIKENNEEAIIIGEIWEN